MPGHGKHAQALLAAWILHPSGTPAASSLCSRVLVAAGASPVSGVCYILIAMGSMNRYTFVSARTRINTA